MLMQEPKVEFISIETSEIVTGCVTSATKASITTCDCTDGAEGGLVGCVGDIV